MRTHYRSIFIFGIIAFLGLSSCSNSTTTPPATPSVYVATPIIADVAGYGASVLDTNLKNPWGIVNAPSSPFYVANNHSATLGEYDYLTGAIKHTFTLTDSIGSNPTGIVYNSDNTSFIIPGNGASTYLFATESGMISGLSFTSGFVARAVDKHTTSSFKGLAINPIAGAPLLFAANFSNGSVDVFDKNFNRTQYTDKATTDPIPSNYAPFNCVMAGGTLYVTFAQQKGDGDDQSGAGNGYVDVFNGDGTFQKRLISRGALNSPWGVAIAPDNFGDKKGKLLVGNFGDGTINVYDPSNGSYIGPLKDASGNALFISGLWSLYVSDGTLYYTAGPAGEAHGVLGKITVK